MNAVRSWLAVYFASTLAPIIISSNDAWSADLCKAVALRDVAAIEAPDSVLARGSYDEAVTQYRVNKQTGMTTFCSHGGYCYPTHVRINGQKVEALRLINCKIGSRNYEDKDEVFYSVDVVRQKNTTAELQLDDLDTKFLEMGLCGACAGNVAMFYVKNLALNAPDWPSKLLREILSQQINYGISQITVSGDGNISPARVAVHSRGVT